jgi:hypothetical protein
MLATLMALTEPAKHNILCLIAVSGTCAGPKRESGAIPELPRSGNWERTKLERTELLFRGLGSDGVGRPKPTPRSPKTCRNGHLHALCKQQEMSFGI